MRLRPAPGRRCFAALAPGRYVRWAAHAHAASSCLPDGGARRPAGRPAADCSGNRPGLSARWWSVVPRVQVLALALQQVPVWAPRRKAPAQRVWRQVCSVRFWAALWAWVARQVWAQVAQAWGLAPAWGLAQAAPVLAEALALAVSVGLPAAQRAAAPTAR